MIIKINDTLRIAQTNTCYVIQERRNKELEFVTTKYFTTLNKALRRAVEMTTDTTEQLELKETGAYVESLLRKFVKDMELSIEKLEEKTS